MNPLFARIGLLASLSVAGCGGSNAQGAVPASSSATSGSAAPSAARTGVAIHVQNVRVSGALPDETAPAVDRLDVQFELVLTLQGGDPITGLLLAHARLVHDDGREIVFGVFSDDWDGSIQPGQQRVLVFNKNPDTAQPIARRSLCGLHMRLEVSFELAGRQAHATSRHVRVECPNQPAQ